MDVHACSRFYCILRRVVRYQPHIANNGNSSWILRRYC